MVPVKQDLISAYIPIYTYESSGKVEGGAGLNGVIGAITIL